ncbi:MAG: hypothetical protein SCH98_04275 [Deferrisomatales bacterium]|jgi:hypothetical protein|nr:hypothetical protein [Deferrisomatales bacterium]
MRDKRNLHLKVQELADCYKGTDPLKEMCLVAKDADPDEAALKWIALAVLHGVNSNAKRLCLQVGADGEAAVTAEYRKGRLPSPGGTVAKKAVEALRQITHFEKDKESGPLAVGWGNESLELRVKVRRNDKRDIVEIEFPR